MSDDLAAWLRSQVDDDETLSESDYDIMISARKVRDAAAEITRLRARVAELGAAVTQCRTLSAMLTPQANRIAELEAALDQLLDDMRDGLCVCQQAKDEARAALGGKDE